MCFIYLLCSALLLKDSPEAAEQEELLRLREQARERRKELEAVEVAIEDDGGMNSRYSSLLVICIGIHVVQTSLLACAHLFSPPRLSFTPRC